MNVLLLYPPFPDTFWSFKHALKFVQKRAAFPPLGLLTVAAMLPPHWNLRLVDCNVRALREDDLAWADTAMVSAMAVQRTGARRIIERCRRAGLTIVAGGPLFTNEHEDFPQVDHFVLGEAEVALPAFLADFAAGTARRIYQPQGFADLHQTPMPLWRLADLQHYASMSVQYSRGCPFDCEFCSVTAMLGHRPRTKQASQIIGELDSLHAAGWNGPIFFVDDNLLGNRKTLRQDLLPALARWRVGRRVAFQTEASINLADDPEMTRAMVAAGFDTVFVGIETPSDEGLAECHKVQNRRRNLLDDVRRLHRAGLQVQGGFIVGFDSDTPSIFQRQIDFIQASGIVTAMVGLLQAPVGTRLYERMAREGRLLGGFTGDNVNGQTNIRTRMDSHVLSDGYQRLMQQIYAPKHYYARVRTFLHDYHPTHLQGRPWPQSLAAFGRSLVLLGIVGRERFQYWKLLIGTFIRRPRLVPLAVTLAIFGHHLRKVTELHLRPTPDRA